jgi:hypothetical protein
MDAEGRVTNVTYAVSIYPYLADRQDEFDVAVYVFPSYHCRLLLTLKVVLLLSSSPRQKVGTLSKKIPMEWAKSSPTKPNPGGSLLVSLIMVADEGG